MLTLSVIPPTSEPLLSGFRLLLRVDSELASLRLAAAPAVPPLRGPAAAALPVAVSCPAPELDTAAPLALAAAAAAAAAASARTTVELEVATLPPFTPPP